VPKVKSSATHEFDDSLHQGNTNGSMVGDVVSLLGGNPLVQESLRKINFDVQSYNNRLSMGTVGANFSDLRQSDAQRKSWGVRSSVAKPGQNFFS